MSAPEMGKSMTKPGAWLCAARAGVSFASLNAGRNLSLDIKEDCVEHFLKLSHHLLAVIDFVE